MTDRPMYLTGDVEYTLLTPPTTFQEMLIKMIRDWNAGKRLTLSELVDLSGVMATEKFSFEDYSLEHHLCHLMSEVSEVYEAACRDGLDLLDWDYEGDRNKPEGVPIELADVALKLFAICGYYGIDLEKAIEVKLTYNATRKPKRS